MKNSPIIIIGAGRSGTNMLRDTICKIDGYVTWPCDEIKYIWQKGNIGKKSDRFTEEDVRPEVKKFIINEFNKLEKNTNANFIVEKTCANSLKVPFIYSIFPDAKFIFIIRNGLDVASSAKKRWEAPLEIEYIKKKARFIPKKDIPYYGYNYLKNRIKKLLSKENHLACWGPIYNGMMEDLKEKDLIDICLLQWKNCVETAVNDLKKLDQKNVHYLKYENFVSNPQEEMMKIFKFLHLEISKTELNNAIGKVSAKSIGNYKKHLTEVEIKRLETLSKATMENIYAAL